MDRWRYFDITHRNHLICNPLSSEKLDELIEVLSLPAGASVLDVGCGKGELLRRLADRYAAGGIGIDLSPQFAATARQYLKERHPDAPIEILEMDGAAFSGPPESFDLAACLGASWIWNGYRGTVRALARFARPGGLVLCGEPFYKRDPEQDYLEAEGFEHDTFATHEGNVSIGIENGLIPIYALVSGSEDFDRYEALQWQAAERWAIDHPDDPDQATVLERSRRARDIYLRWGRDTIGWALYLFIKPPRS